MRYHNGVALIVRILTLFLLNKVRLHNIQFVDKATTTAAAAAAANGRTG